jgi:hypothetical protein
MLCGFELKTLDKTLIEDMFKIILFVYFEITILETFKITSNKTFIINFKSYSK